MIHGIWECTQHAVPFVIMWDREEPPVGRSLNVAREKTSRYPLVARLSRRRIGTLGVSIKGHAGTYQWYPPWMTTRGRYGTKGGARYSRHLPFFYKARL